MRSLKAQQVIASVHRWTNDNIVFVERLKRAGKMRAVNLGAIRPDDNQLLVSSREAILDRIGKLLTQATALLWTIRDRFTENCTHLLYSPAMKVDVDIAAMCTL